MFSNEYQLFAAFLKFFIPFCLHSSDLRIIFTSAYTTCY